MLSFIYKHVEKRFHQALFIVSGLTSTAVTASSIQNIIYISKQSQRSLDSDALQNLQDVIK